MAQNRVAPMSPTSPYGSVVGMLSAAREPEAPTISVNGSAAAPKSAAPPEVDAGAPAPPRDPSYGVDMPGPAPVQEQRLINPEGLTRKFDEAERRIRRQVTQQMERGVRIVPPVNISALEQGGYTTTSGSRVGYDLKRFAGQNPQGGALGRNTEGNTTARGGGRAPTLTQATRMGGPVDPTGRALLDRFTESEGASSPRAGLAGRRSSANPRGLLDSAQRISRGRAF